MELKDVYALAKENNIARLRISLMTVTLTLLKHHIETADDSDIVRNRKNLVFMMDNALEATDEELLGVVTEPTIATNAR